MSAADGSFLRGAVTAIPTPFRDGVLDLKGLDRLVEHQVRQSIGAIVVGGQTGEGWSLDEDEVGQLVSRASETAADRSRFRMHVIAGVCEIDSRRAARLARHAALAGADAILVSAPPFANPSKSGLVRHVATVAEALPTEIPLVLANESTRSGTDLTAKVIERIANEVPTVAAHCEGVGRPARARSLAREIPIPLLAGDDRLIGPFLRGGAVGAVTVIGNLVPAETRELVDALLDGDRAADAKERGLASLVDALRVGPNPVPIKAALAALGAIEDEVRRPLVGLSARKRGALARALTLAKLLVPAG